jgi:subtilisin family serine protease
MTRHTSFWRIFIMLMLICMTMVAVAQTAETGKLSAFVRHALRECLREQHATRSDNDQRIPQHILAFVKVNDGPSLLQKYGCQTYAQWGDIHIARIPLSNLEALSAESQVERIEARASARQLLDTATIVINALPVYETTHEHQAFTGDGVVVGLMDIGFDLTHPNFYNRDRTHYRIGAIWDQLSKDTLGSVLPAGRDYIGAEAVLAHAHSTDGEIQYHGTHTLGIAAGSGYDTPYRGVAFDSDICLVSNIEESDTAYYQPGDKYLHTNALDALGFKYLFDYAERQGKPCVASFSEGYPPYFDEEDSLYAAVLDSLSGPGRIIVASAGNEGLVKSHVEKLPEAKEAGAFILCDDDEAEYRIKGYGSAKLHLYRYGNETSVPTDTLTTELATLPYETEVTDSLICNGDTLTLALYRKRSVYQPNEVWYVTLNSNRSLSNGAPLALTIEGDTHAELFGNSLAAFHTHDIDSRWQAAQAGHNIFAPSSFKSVISVGATSYRAAMKNMWGGPHKAHEGTIVGRISPYSSTGPTVDGMIKPDVVAPGTYIISSLSHYCPARYSMMAESEVQGTIYPWGLSTGTSMSAPMVAGTIALWLQAKPTLTTDEILDVFRRTCQHPDPEINYPNSIYGYGEIDAYRGLLDILGADRIEGLSLQQPSRLHVYPSKSGLRLMTDTPVTETLNIRIYSLSGTCFHQGNVFINGTEALLTLPPYAAGIYVIQIDTNTPELRGSQLIRL